MGLLDELDDLQLLCGRISHSPSSPSPVTLFLRTRFSRVRSATTSLSAMASRRRSLTSSEVAARAVSPARRFFPASGQPSTSYTRVPSRSPRFDNALLCWDRYGDLRALPLARLILVFLRGVCWTSLTACSFDGWICRVFLTTLRFDVARMCQLSFLTVPSSVANGGRWG